MADTSDMLNGIDVTSPCTQSWEAMTGDASRRFCGECRLHVHNLSAMTSDEAQTLLGNADGRLCVRFYRRPDGTVLTQDCVPVRTKLRKRLRRLRVAAAALFGLLSPLGLGACSDGGAATDNGGVTITPAPGAHVVPGIDPELIATMGEPLMGDVLLPEERLTPEETPDTDTPDPEIPDTKRPPPEQPAELEDAPESGDDPPYRETIGRMIVR